MSGDAIKKTSGPCVILAGAGTGKTYTIVEKIKHIVKNNIYAPEKIVCVTFSNEAANNLLLRVDKILASEGVTNHNINIKTFHGFSSDLLRKYGDKIGINKEFKILDPEQAMVVLHRSLKINAINCKRYISTISTAKDLGIKIEEFKEYVERNLVPYKDIDLEKHLESLSFELQTLHLKKETQKKGVLLSQIKKLKKIIDMKKFVAAWNAYEKIKQKVNYQDYSDLNKNALLLLQKNPEIAKEYDYIIVDEFQDTNKLQLDFLIALSREKNITVVGDLNQSIYRFRGAYKDNLNIFKKAFNVTQSDVFNLAKSYRSSNTILRTAHKLVLNNYDNKEDCFFVENAFGREGEAVEVYETRDVKEESRKVVEIVQREIENGTPVEEICILFRTHQYTRIVKRALEQAGIEFYAVSRSSLLKQKSIKTVHDYLVILNKIKKKEKGGEQEWWDLIYNLKFAQDDLIKIGKEIKKFTKEKNDEPLSLYLINNLGALSLSDSGKIAAKILLEKINSLFSYMDNPISKLVQEIFRISGLMNEQKTREEKEIMLNLNKFYELAKSHEELYDSDLDNFLFYLQVLTDLEINIEAAQLEESGVRLMTSHATKGLEYKVVIVTNFAQGRFPMERYVSNSLIPTELLSEVKENITGLAEDEKDSFIINYEKHNQLLEERRLAYVSFTRAKEKLIITYANEYNNKKVSPSQFLSEIDFKSNEDILLTCDLEQKSTISELEVRPAATLIKVINSGNFDEGIANLVSAKHEKDEIKKFSPSALRLFSECQKEFEYKYVFNMPERKTVSWDAMRIGSFVHLVLEKGVSQGLNKIENFLQLSKELSLDEEWESISLSEAQILIKVFFERNKGKYNEKSKTEQYLPLHIEDLEFMGFADRIDFNSEGEAVIVDYKTGKTSISPKDRNWQLGFYALAARKKYGKVRKVILDMLKQDRPLEFEIDEKGNAVCTSSSRMDGFNIFEVERELVQTAKSIQAAYSKGFASCPIEKNCEFCNEYVYGL